MRSYGPTLSRILVVLAGVGAASLLLDAGLGPPGPVLAFMAVALAGAIANRWWAIAVPCAATVVWALVTYAIDPGGFNRGSDITTAGAVVIVSVLSLAVALVVGLGVALRRLAETLGSDDRQPRAVPSP